MTWQIASDVAHIVAASHVFLLSILYALRARGWERWISVFMGGGGVAFLVFPLVYEANPPWFVLLPIAVLQSGLTFWFWLFALCQGREDFRPVWWHWLLLCGKVLVTILWASPRRELILPIGPDEQFVWRALVPALVSIGFAIAAVFASGHQVHDDLVEDRLRMRRLLVLWGAGGTVLAVGIVLVFRGPVLGDIGSWLIAFMALGACVSVHAWLLRATQVPGERSASRSIPDSLEFRALAERIEELFRSESYYATEGLTLRQLAQRLNERDYRVRRAINHVMGYRNFNAFLNQHRVAEAKRRLVSEADLPVLRLAMDLGYRSLAVFNKAFKETTGRTPTDFRRAKSSD